MRVRVRVLRLCDLKICVRDTQLYAGEQYVCASRAILNLYTLFEFLDIDIDESHSDC